MPQADYSDLKALFVNCTLKRSPETSNTQGLMDKSIEVMREQGVEVDCIRAIDHDLAIGVWPDMTEHGWERDEWPAIYERVIAADILVLGMPIWLGEKSSVATHVIERLYGNSHLLNDQGQWAYYGRVGGCIVTGNEDGIKHCAMNVLYSLQHLGYTIPPQADSGWIGEAGPGPSYLDEGSGGPENDFTNRNTTFAAWNLMHLARILKDAGGIPAHGNQPKEWKAGCRFDFAEPRAPQSSASDFVPTGVGRKSDALTRAHRAPPSRRGPRPASTPAEGAGEAAEAVAVAGADQQVVVVADCVRTRELKSRARRLRGARSRRGRESGPAAARSARRRPRSPARCRCGGSLIPSTRFQARLRPSTDSPTPADQRQLVWRWWWPADSSSTPRPSTCQRRPGTSTVPSTGIPARLRVQASARAAGAGRLDRGDLAEPQAGAQPRPVDLQPRPVERHLTAAGQQGGVRPLPPPLAVPENPEATASAARPRPAPRRASAPRRRGDVAPALAQLAVVEERQRGRIHRREATAQ